jgi:uncharacterized membrane protein
MMHSNLVLALAFGIGVVAGLRAMTAPTVVSWAAHLHWINLGGSHLAFMGTTVAVIIFSALALGELVNDKLPKTGSRTEPPQLIARIVMGAFAACVFCLGAGASAVVGAILGAVGAVAGTFGGYQARTRSVRALHVPDFVIALVEDVIAVGGGFLLVSRL